MGYRWERNCRKIYMCLIKPKNSQCPKEKLSKMKNPPPPKKSQKQNLNVQKTYPQPRVRIRVRSASLFENGGHHVVKIVIGVGIIEAFRESIDEDAGIGRLHINLRVGAVIVRDGEEDVPRHLVRIVPLPGSATRSIGVFAIIIQQMIPNHRVHLDLAQEAAAGFDDAEQEEGGRGGDGGVDAVLDGGEDGDEDASQENDDFEG